MSNLRVLYLIRNNIRALLMGRGQNQTELAFWMGHDKSWINKFLNGSREIQFKDLDRIADFFGIAAYQLLQPGISRLTERRKGYDRRASGERRVGHTQRVLRGELEKNPRREKDTPHEAATLRKTAALQAFAIEFAARADRLLAEQDLGGQTPKTSGDLPKARARRRAAGERDAPKS